MSTVSSDRERPRPLCAILCHLQPDDEEVLELLLDILGWKCSTIEALSPEHCATAKLIFVDDTNTARKAADLELFEFICIVGADNDSLANMAQNGGSVQMCAISSPINLNEAELVIGSASILYQ